MDSQDQILQKLTAIDRNLKSVRYTFGIVLIILAVLLAIAAPVIVGLVQDNIGRAYGASRDTTITPLVGAPVRAVTPTHAAPALATTTAQ